MPEIDPNYASPFLRWALLLEDHPNAEYDAEWVPSDEEGVPPQFGGGPEAGVCKVTITFPPASGLDPVSAIRPADKDRNGRPKMGVDDWLTLRTKTLGRALKAAGYPANMPELKALVVWRKRVIELEALQSGRALPELGSGFDATDTIEGALEAAVAPDPEAVDHDPDDQASEGEGELVDDADVPAAMKQAEQFVEQAQARRPPTPPTVPDTGRPSPTEPGLSAALKARLREVINEMAKSGAQPKLREWALAEGIGNFAKPETPEAAEAVIAKAQELLAEAG